MGNILVNAFMTMQVAVQTLVNLHFLKILSKTLYDK